MAMYYPEITYSPDEVLEYLRKSRSDDPSLTVEEVLEKHETILDEWAEKYMGERVPEANKYREVVSGETIDDRPEIKKVLKLIESPKIKAILVVEVQRLSRGDLEDAGRIIKLLRYTNTVVITPQKTYDLQNEYDRDFFERELKRGNEFLEYQKKIMARGRMLSVQQGNYIGNTAPYGYEKVTVQEGKKKCHTLAIKEDEAEVVRMIYDMYVNQDMGRVTIGRRLDSLGIKPPRGENWSQTSVRDILTNIHYTGKVRWNWRKTVSVVEDGEVVKMRPRARYGEYDVFDGKHPAIISDEIYIAAQNKKEMQPRVKKQNKIRNPLATLVYCQCGRSMTLRTYRNGGEDRAEPRLLCSNQAICKTSSCTYAEMLDRVCDVLRDSIADFEIKMRETDNNARQAQLDHIKRLEARLAELDRKEVAQWEKYAEEGMPKSIFDRLNEKVKKDKAETAQALDDARHAVPDPIDYEEKITRFRDALDALKDPDISAEHKNKLLKACIERIDYSREKAQRIKSQQKRVTINGKRTYQSPLKTGANWTEAPIELDVKLKV